jgi:branched-chain amino acid transport system ATP-binding protein
MIDELSLGLAPVVVERLLDALKRAHRELDMTVLFVEQDADLAMDTAQRVVVLSAGQIAFDGSADEAGAARSRIEDVYLGLPVVADV